MRSHLSYSKYYKDTDFILSFKPSPHNKIQPIQILEDVGIVFGDISVYQLDFDIKCINRTDQKSSICFRSQINFEAQIKFIMQNFTMTL
jgi:hypothetical protein